MKVLVTTATERGATGLVGDFRGWDEVTTWAAGIADTLGPDQDGDRR